MLTKKLIKPIFKDLFAVCLILYLILYILEWLQPGFVSFYIQADMILILTLISG
ncbi:hypothetical protein HQ571_03220, partial [Candidatus Kuenenbacteria bacterium]|nr:hypothetical protein [Candidatus Kuenenbacteria bacterium]